jgi:hypothetical protein
VEELLRDLIARTSRVETKLDAMNYSFNESSKVSSARFLDQETRIRSLEIGGMSMKTKMTAIVAVVSLVGSSIGATLIPKMFNIRTNIEKPQK